MVCLRRLIRGDHSRDIYVQGLRDFYCTKRWFYGKYVTITCHPFYCSARYRARFTFHPCPHHDYPYCCIPRESNAPLSEGPYCGRSLHLPNELAVSYGLRFDVLLDSDWTLPCQPVFVDRISCHLFVDHCIGPCCETNEK